MSTCAALDRAAERLGEWTTLDPLAARGTVRLVLKDAGLDAASVTRAQMVAVARRLLPAALRSRGVADPEAVAERICGDVATVRDDGAGRETPERVFARLGS